MRVSILMLATLYDGRDLAGDFDEMHKLAEQIAGHPIWTHQFAQTRVWDELRQGASEAFPDIAEVPQHEDWEVYRDALLDRFGESVEITVPE